MSVTDNIARIRQRMARAASRAGRDPARIRLVAVTKTVDDERIREAVRCGIDGFGENYVQEARRKIGIGIGGAAPWHMIGHLQTNKAKYAVHLFDMVHTVDRMDLARELDRRAGLAGRVLPVLVEVHTSEEDTKRGVRPGDAIPLIREMASLPHLAIRGLMTMPPWFDDPERARPYFRALRELRDRIASGDIPGVEMGELSMGMSDDFEVAIEEGATMVRIGRGIFGERPGKTAAGAETDAGG